MTDSAAASEAAPRALPSGHYLAFISYRHADNIEEDRRWATWLHQQLEVYDVPAELIGTVNGRGELIPERIYPVFRDEVSLPADADLSATITDALDRSQYLIVLCSPRAVASNYVAEEITHFKATGKSDRVIGAMLFGEPNASRNSGFEEIAEDPRTLECFPRPLQYEIDEAGRLLTDRPTEPIAADFRLPDGGEGCTNPDVYKRQLLAAGRPAHEAEKLAEAYGAQINLSRLKIIAGILGVTLDTLTERDKAHQLRIAKAQARRARRIGAVLGCMALIAATVAVVAWNQYQEADAQRLRAEALLDEVRSNLSFMNYDLPGVLERYVPTGPRREVNDKIKQLVESLSEHGAGSSEELHAAAVARNQEAALLLKAAGEDPAAALPLMLSAIADFEKLVEAFPENALYLRDAGVAYAQLGGLYLRLGDTDKAMRSYQQDLTISKRLLALQPEDSGLQRDLAVSREKLARAYLWLGNTTEALAQTQRALELRLGLASTSPENLRWQRDLASSYSLLGDVQRRMGNTGAALVSYQQDMDVAARLLQADPADVQARFDLSMSHEKLGDMAVELGKPDAALIEYEKALEMMLVLVAHDPENTELQSGLGVSYQKLGNVRLNLDNTEAALVDYQRALEIAQAMSRQDPASAEFQRALAVAHENVGDAQTRLSDSAGALANYERSLALRLQLAARDSANTEFLRDVSVAYEKIATAQLALLRTDEALENFQRGLDTALDLVAADPENSELQRDIIISNFQMGRVHEQLEHPEPAAAYYRAALEKALWMRDRGLLSPRDQHMVNTVQVQLDGLSVGASTSRFR